LAHGKFLYVNDLVATEGAGSEGHGMWILAWLVGVAREEGFGTLQLGSGVTRHAVHRFYMREKVSISSYRFSKAV